MILRLLALLLICSPSSLAHSEVTPGDLPARDPTWTFRRGRDLLRTADYRGVPLGLVTRAMWKAKKITEPYEPNGNIKGIVIHHSESTENTTVLSIQDYHQRVKKWADIGYHYLIAQFPTATGKMEWRIFEGHPLTAKGAHAGHRGDEDLNPGQIGICIVGDYDQASTGEKPPNLLQPDPRAVYLLGLLVENLMDRYGAQVKEILGHAGGDHAIFPGHKSCPGAGCFH